MIRKTALRLFAALFLTGVFGSMTACNTMHGVGQDIEKGGEKIQRQADKR